ncbi:MAG: flagellar biosynthesis protein FliQ [Deltaproteobacteria bacterium]|nr:flagellar biosynthesis protein FliQ [Deltaproteobacteria bacterium]
MHAEQVLDITRQALKVAVMLSAPMLAFGMIAGLIINVFQAVTQITETTLSIIPKMLAMLVALLLFSPWMLDVMTDFTVQLFENIPTLIR